MDDSLYEALIGEAPAPGAEQKAIAETLRRRRSIGELGALTGDRVLQPFGGHLIKQADQYATDLQGIRQKDTDNAQTERYQTGQLDHMGNVLGETRRANDMDFILGLAMARAAQTRADKPPAGAGPKAPPRLRQNDIKELRETAEAVAMSEALIEYLDGGGSLGAVGDVPVAGSLLRKGMNMSASAGLGTEESKASAMAWQNYRRFYELAQRNALFGATLTPNEQRAWDAANPSGSQTDDQIRKGLEIMNKIYDQRGDFMAQGLMSEGYSPEAISNYIASGGGISPSTSPQGMTVFGEDTPEGMLTPRPQSVGAGIMTDEKRARLNELRQKRGTK